MGIADIAVFVAFIAAVVFVGVWKSREKDGEKDAQDYFLAGRGLTWWLVGFSLIAANISTEQFVGMSGNAASHVGLAIATYEWFAAITLVIVGFCFLPYFLRVGIYTMPQFLQYRYNKAARLIMAAATVLIYLLLLGSVTYSGALTVQTLAEKQGVLVPLWQPSLFIAVIAMVYVVAGGLKASVWADLLQGSALILGGGIIMWLAFGQLGAAEEAAAVVDVATGEVAIQALEVEKGSLERFMDLNANRLNMFLPSDDPVLPWTALLLGIWIPNFYYWGLNQYITQRTLGSSSLAHGQKGIVFAAYLKLLIPFVVVVPGIVAFNLFHGDMRLNARGDAAKAMAKYAAANPDTQYVRVVENPASEAAQTHEGPVYLLAVCDTEEQLEAATDSGAFVLPILRTAFDEADPAAFQVFSDREDKAWKHVNPELAVEIAAFNEAVEADAEQAGVKPESQALVAYKYDTALGLLLDMLPKNGLFGFVLAALLGAVISSLAAMLNAASSIFTLDLFDSLPGESSEQRLVAVGRTCVIVFAGVACGLAPLLGDPNISNSIFTIIQEAQGYISPGILAVFVVGLIFRTCPRWAGAVGLIASMTFYRTLQVAAPEIQFLNRMAYVFGICVAIMIAATFLFPLKEPIEFKSDTTLDLKGSKGAFVFGMIAIALTAALYVVFSPLVIAK